MDNTDDNSAQDAVEALDNVMDVLRQEFRSNPELAYRVVKALGAEVSFEGRHAGALINPIELVTAQTDEAARATLASLAPSELRAMAKTANLATSVDMKGKAKGDLVDLIHRRAKDKAAERGSAM